MPFGLFRSQSSPILADFGSAGLKLLQVSSGDRAASTAAAFLPFDDELRARPIDERFAHLAALLPATIKEHGFRGNRVVLAPFSQHMLVQHVGLPLADAERADVAAAMQIALTLSCDPNGLVVRTSRVCETNRDGQSKLETLAFAMSREDVMRYVDLFRRAKLTVVGVHGEISALVHAFDHVHRRSEDAFVTTMYADLGYGGTKVAICHGAQSVFAKSIAIGGRSFDAKLAESRGLSLANARALRIAEGVRPVRSSTSTSAAPALTATAPAAMRATVARAQEDEMPAFLRMALSRNTEQSSEQGATVAVDRRSNAPAPALGAALPTEAVRSVAMECRETLEGLCDELVMCARYHGALFRERRIDRVVFLGGEARDVGLCQALATALRLPAKVGDPLARFLANGEAPTGLPEPTVSHPGWAVACGLAASPTDL
jgi:Tfp pilus assembly PilM family ATPase